MPENDIEFEECERSKTGVEVTITYQVFLQPPAPLTSPTPTPPPKPASPSVATQKQ
jgi:hypothetical protein